MIAIVGAGFSGTAVAIHLLQKSSRPLSIFLLDREGLFARGVAYSTPEPQHYLNVRAKDMSLFSDQPDHFCHWLFQNEALWRAQDPFFVDLKIHPHSFLPRKIYGRYLEDCLQTAQQSSISKLTLLTTEAYDIEQQDTQKFALFLTSGQKLEIDHLVLATGVQTTKELVNSDSIRNYTANIWKPPQGSLLTKDDLSQCEKEVVTVLGSGLTAVDCLMSLFARNFSGKIIVISPKGRFPEPHLNAVTSPMPSAHSTQGLHALVRTYRQRVEEARQHGLDWRPIVDSLRSSSSKIWNQFTLSEKKQFMRHLFGIWNRHRHRMPPECFKRIERARETGQLKIITGRFQSIEQCPQGIAKIRLGDKFIETDHLFNCMGPDYRVEKNTTLLTKCCEKGLLVPDALGLGVISLKKEQIHVMGSLLLGEKFETTAVPELREQAKEIALKIIETSSLDTN